MWTIGGIAAALLVVAVLLASWFLKGAGLRGREEEEAEAHVVKEQADVADGEAAASKEEAGGEPAGADSREEAADIPVPEAGMRATVTDPIPGRGYGEICVRLNGVDYFFMAACHGVDLVPEGAQVTVAEVRDGVVLVLWEEEAAAGPGQY